MNAPSPRKILAPLALGLFLVLPGIAQAKPSDQEIQKVIKTVVNAIRFNKDDVAAKQVAFRPMAEAIMDDAWKELDDAQKKEIVAGVETLIRRISFAKGREMFQHLDAILYNPIEVKGPKVNCRATVVVHRNYKKTEIVIDFVLVQDEGAWRIMDTVMAGESTTMGIHEDQVEPLLEKGGIPAVLKALREKIAEVS